MYYTKATHIADTFLICLRSAVCFTFMFYRYISFCFFSTKKNTQKIYTLHSYSTFKCQNLKLPAINFPKFRLIKMLLKKSIFSSDPSLKTKSSYYTTDVYSKTDNIRCVALLWTRKSRKRTISIFGIRFITFLYYFLRFSLFFDFLYKPLTLIFKSD